MKREDAVNYIDYLFYHFCKRDVFNLDILDGQLIGALTMGVFTNVITDYEYTFISNALSVIRYCYR